MNEIINIIWRPLDYMLDKYWLLIILWMGQAVMAYIHIERLFKNREDLLENKLNKKGIWKSLSQVLYRYKLFVFLLLLIGFYLGNMINGVGS